MKNILKTLVLVSLSLLSLLVISCEENTGKEETGEKETYIGQETFYLASEREMTEWCYRYSIRYSEDGEWQYFYNEIEGLEYEEGFEYHVTVDIYELDPSQIMADASSVRYELVTLHSKVRKDSFAD